MVLPSYLYACVETIPLLPFLLKIVEISLILVPASFYSPYKHSKPQKASFPWEVLEAKVGLTMMI